MEQEILTYLHYGNWNAVLIWFIIFGLFIAFLPFQRKSRTKPTSMYTAFILASALEMFGIPLSMYFIAWVFGVSMPVGLLWGHTLAGYIGLWGMYVGYALNLIGGALIILGWKAVYARYWSKEEGEGTLVTDGIYAYIRHPQYTGFILMTLGLLVHWATIPLLIMWPALVFQYYRLAKREEKEMEEEFEDEYTAYKKRVPMFIPIPSRVRYQKHEQKTHNIESARKAFLMRSSLGGSGLFAVYLIVLTLGNSFEHATAQLIEWWHWVLILVVGFGIQIGLFYHLRELAGTGRSRGSKSSLAVGGGVSASSMIACCLHHVTDLIPLVGISAATLLLSKYQTVFMSLGLLSNVVGILFMLDQVQRFSDSAPSDSGLLRLLSQYDLRRIRNISALSSVALFAIILASASGVFPAYSQQAEASELVREQNGVTFTIKPIDIDDGAIGFRMGIDTHQGSLSFDLMEVATLWVRGMEYKPQRWEGSPPGGHHRSGILVFPKPSETGGMKLMIRDVYNVPERAFEWGIDSASSSLNVYFIGSISAVVGLAVVFGIRSKKQNPYDVYDSLFEEEYRKFKEARN